MSPTPAPVRLADRTSLPTTMPAVVHDRYGSLDALELRTVPVPTPSDGEVLIEVGAAAVHVGDVFGVRGEPLPIRLATGLLRPKRPTPGYDVAGRIVAVGSGVTGLAIGDMVYGACAGSCAGFALARPEQLAAMPRSLELAEAAAIPTSATAALRGLRDAGRLHSGQRVLVIGAAGGVGSFAVQIARSLGAEVTGVCGPSNVELVRSLGAHHVVDYTRDDFAAAAGHYDLVLDNVENRPLADLRRACTPRGTIVCNSGTGTRGLRTMIRLLHPLVLSPFVGQRLVRFVCAPNRADLETLADLVARGELRPVIGRRFALADTAEALAHVAGGHARGKTIVTP